MLPARHRMRRAPDFRSTVRRGGRAGGQHLMVHLLVPDVVAGVVPAMAEGTAPGAGGTMTPGAQEDENITLVGLIVPRAVGDAVRRTLVKRRLRHVMAHRLGAVPAGSTVVVRAGAGAAQASSAVLAAEVDAALVRCLRPRRARAPRSSDPAATGSGARR